MKLFRLVWSTKPVRDVESLEGTARCLGDHTHGATELGSWPGEPGCQGCAGGQGRTGHRSGGGRVRLALPTSPATGSTPSSGPPPSPPLRSVLPAPSSPVPPVSWSPGRYSVAAHSGLFGAAAARFLFLFSSHFQKTLVMAFKR